MAGNRVNLTFNMSDGEEHSASFVLPGEEQKLQSDIYDRTKGVGAIPGAFGYGSDLVNIDAIVFNDIAEFLTWVQNTRSGRYVVRQLYGSEPIISGVVFSGILEVIQTGSVNNEEYLPDVNKNLIFYGANLGDIWYTRFFTQPNTLDDWRCLDQTRDVLNLQRAINKKAALNSPLFTGTPGTPTPPDDAAGTEIANAEFVRKLISASVDSEKIAKQSNIYDTSEGVVAIPGCLGYGMTLNGGLSLSLISIDEIALQVNQLEPGRYYATIGTNDDHNGVFEIIWLDNWKNDKTKETATKLVLFFGSDGSIRSTVRGSDASAPVSWLDLTNTFGSAAGMDVQSTIYDRTDGVVARPGAFGYGAFYSVSKQFTDADGPAEFLMWVMQTPPGRYLVEQVESSGATKIINGVNFVGTVEIEQPYLGVDAGSTASFNKLVNFYGVDGDIYHNRFIADPSKPHMSGWFTLKNQIDFLRSTTGNSWGSPGVGGIMFGVYLGESDSDSSRQLVRGKTIPGSRIACASIRGIVSAPGLNTSAVTLDANSNEVQAGTFVALSGSPSYTVGSNDVLVSLFMRIA